MRATKAEVMEEHENEVDDEGLSLLFEVDECVTKLKKTFFEGAGGVVELETGFSYSILRGVEMLLEEETSSKETSSKETSSKTNLFLKDRCEE